MVQNAQQPVTDAVQDLQSKIGPQIEEARQNLEQMNERATAFIRQNPGTCLLGAIALGFLVGRLASR